VSIDIGTGDGRFVYESARQNADRFYIGVDANARALEKISERIYRRPRKGGAPNALFVQAAAESLPEELSGIADEVWVQFPWGTLLAAVASPHDTATLSHLRGICAPGATLRVVVAVDPARDRTEMDRLGLKPLSLEYVDSVLAPHYRNAGFAIVQRDCLTAEHRARPHTTWAKRLSRSDRVVWSIVARAD
jgi:16S rRNA (adenine(1408)-N(1))-methyltransferase